MIELSLCLVALNKQQIRNSLDTGKNMKKSAGTLNLWNFEFGVAYIHGSMKWCYLKLNIAGKLGQIIVKKFQLKLAYWYSTGSLFNHCLL